MPFGRIHVFIGKIGGSEPEPDIRTDIVELAWRMQHAWVQAGRRHASVGFTQGVELAEDSASGGETLIYSGEDSSTGEKESIYQLQDDCRTSGSADP